MVICVTFSEAVIQPVEIPEVEVDSGTTTPPLMIIPSIESTSLSIIYRNSWSMVECVIEETLTLCFFYAHNAHSNDIPSYLK